MRVCGIICEYNPFHNGHAYQIRRVREQTGCDFVVCVMSGHFTQRGEPALLSKWARAEMALACGADAVFELPALFAVRDAERFARGGVDLLDALGVVTDLGFGSESGDIDALRQWAEADENTALVKAGLSKGWTLARARANAVVFSAADGYVGQSVQEHDNPDQPARHSSITSDSVLPSLPSAPNDMLATESTRSAEHKNPDQPPRHPSITNESVWIPITSAPNDILAVEYIRAIQKRRSNMNPVAVLRHGSAHHDSTIHTFASATGIRQALQRGENVQRAMPQAAFAILSAAMARGEAQKPGGLDSALFYLLRTMTKDRLATIADVSEGLENRILKMAQRTSSKDTLLSAVKCKRYTWTRLSRILTQAMLGISKELAASHPSPAYARLLAFRKEARPLLSAIEKNSGIPVIVRAAKAPAYIRAALSIDFAAGDIWSLGLIEPSLRYGGRDLQSGVVIR